MDTHVGKHQGRLVAQYRGYLHMSQQDLADAMHLSLRTVQRMELEIVIRDPERRKFLVGLLGIPAASMNLEPEEVPPVQQTRLVLNGDRMAFYEEQLEARWKLLYMGGPLHALAGLESWLYEIEDFARTASGTQWHQRSLTVLCMSYQLKGGAIRDILNYEEASKACQKALLIATELNDPELKASTLVREGVTSLRQEKPIEAIAQLKEALVIIKDRGFISLRGNILQSLAQAYAKSRQSRNCWSTIELAESVLQQKTQVQERSQRVFSVASLKAAKGINAFLLGDYERALALFDKGLSACNATMIPKRASMTMYKAEAYFKQGNIDIATATAEEAWNLACSVGTRVEITRVKKLYADLMQSRWKNEGYVRRLGGVIASRN
jgi:tetratricopeptide (TPR) repeat protein